jgi:hypothetical protein
MELDGLANLALDFLDGCPGCNTSREIRHVCRIVRPGVLDDDRISHGGTLLLEAGLLPDAVQGSRGKLIARLARDRDSPRLHRVLELAMTSAGGDQQPAFVSKQPEDLADFHAQDYAPGILPPSTCGLT